MNSETKAQDIIRSKGGIIRTVDAQASGIHPRTLYQLRDSGILEQLSRGVFKLAEKANISDPDLVIVAMRVPKGVLCLVSALAYHGITTQIPHEVSIAVPQGSKAPKIDNPPVRIHKYSDATYSMGIEEHMIDGVKIRVYDPEKTLVDCFRFRNVLGMDVVLEALKLYRSRMKMDINKLMRYASASRIKTVITPYLEATL